MKKLFIGAMAALTFAVVPLASAGATTPAQKTFIKDIEKAAPGLKKYTNASLIKISKDVCSDLRHGNTV